MDHTIYLIAFATCVWWFFGVSIFAIMTTPYDAPPLWARVGSSVFWPLLAVPAIIIILWRLPFKTTKAIRVDLNNRRLLKEFNAWNRQRKEAAAK